MTTAENKRTARRIVLEVIGSSDLAVVDELFAPEYLDHTLPPDVPPGREGFKNVLSALRAAFPDLEYTVEHEIAEGDLVAQRLLAKGTLLGDFMGMKPTGKTAVWQEMHLHRFGPDGRLVEHWGTSDDLGMLLQLGLGPPM